MKYLNKRTGAVIDVPCRLEGPDWEEVTEAKKAEPAQPAQVKEALKKTAQKKAVRKGADA